MNPDEDDALLDTLPPEMTPYFCAMIRVLLSIHVGMGLPLFVMEGLYLTMLLSIATEAHEGLYAEWAQDMAADPAPMHQKVRALYRAMELEWQLLEGLTE